MQEEDFGTILDIDTSDAQEPAAVEEGEYLIRITGFNKDKEGQIIRSLDDGRRYFIVNFDIPSEEFSKSLSQYMGIPSDDTEPKQANSMKWALEIFKKAFNLDEFNFNTMIGREGYAILRVEESEEYGAQNKIKKFIAGA